MQKPINFPCTEICQYHVLLMSNFELFIMSLFYQNIYVILEAVFQIRGMWLIDRSGRQKPLMSFICKQIQIKMI